LAGNKAALPTISRTAQPTDLSSPAPLGSAVLGRRGIGGNIAEAKRLGSQSLICSDELGYVPLAATACALMFQVIADRAEKAAGIVTTNQPSFEC